MSNEPRDPNPYAPTSSGASFAPEPEYGLTAAEQKKVEAIIKDAGQFWLAILICIACSLLGILITAPWYLVRLLQWNSLAQRYPALVAQDAPPDSLARRFQSARWKLITGIVLAAVLFVAIVGLFVLSVTVSTPR